MPHSGLLPGLKEAAGVVLQLRLVQCRGFGLLLRTTGPCCFVIRTAAGGCAGSRTVLPRLLVILEVSHEKSLLACLQWVLLLKAELGVATVDPLSGQQVRSERCS